MGEGKRPLLLSGAIRFCLISSLCLSGYTSTQSPGDELVFPGECDIILPNRIGVNHTLPIVVIIPDQNPRLAQWEIFYLSSPGVSIFPSELSVK